MGCTRVWMSRQQDDNSRVDDKTPDGRLLRNPRSHTATRVGFQGRMRKTSSEKEFARRTRSPSYSPTRMPFGLSSAEKEGEHIILNMESPSRDGSKGRKRERD